MPKDIQLARRIRGEARIVLKIRYTRRNTQNSVLFRTTPILPKEKSRKAIDFIKISVQGKGNKIKCLNKSLHCVKKLVETNTIVDQWICRNEEIPTPVPTAAFFFEAVRGI